LLRLEVRIEDEWIPQNNMDMDHRSNTNKKGSPTVGRLGLVLSGRFGRQRKTRSKEAGRCGVRGETREQVNVIVNRKAPNGGLLALWVHFARFGTRSPGSRPPATELNLGSAQAQAQLAGSQRASPQTSCLS